MINASRRPVWTLVGLATKTTLVTKKRDNAALIKAYWQGVLNRGIRFRGIGEFNLCLCRKGKEKRPNLYY